MGLNRLTPGLIARDDFTSLAAWTNTSGNWAASSSPALIPFDPSPTPLLTPGGAGSFDYDGVREAQLFIDDDAAGTWWLLYDAGDGVAGWREFLASSTDKGKTWKKQGAVSIGLDNGASGTYAAVANGWLEKRGGVYYLHRVTATSTFAFPDVGLPATHYFGDIWTATSLPGPWTFLRSYGGSGQSPTDLLPGSVVLDSGTYYLVSQGSNPSNAGGLPQIILQTASSPGGPYTVDSRGAIINPGFFSGRNQENPKVFWHPGLGRYCVLLNLIAGDGLHTDANAIVLNDNILNWPSPAKFVIQNANGATDAAYAIGVPCHVTGPGGALVASSDGYVPFTFDGDPRPVPPGQTPNHRGRAIKHAVLEPSAGVATYGDSTGTAYVMSQALTHTDFVAEFALRFADNNTASNVQFWYRNADAAGNNGYRVNIFNGAPASLSKVVGGSLTTPVTATAYGALPGSPYVNRIRISAQGARHRYWQDGVLLWDIIDTTFASGSYVQFCGLRANGAELRGFRVYKAGPVTISGLTAGHVVTLRGAGGLPFATGKASGGSLTLSSAHYPLHSVTVEEVTFTPDDSGLLWGGDSLLVSGAPYITSSKSKGSDAPTAAGVAGTLAAETTQTVTIAAGTKGLSAGQVLPVNFDGARYFIIVGVPTVVPQTVYEILHNGGYV